MPPSVTNPTELRLFSTSSPVMSPRNPPTPAPPGPAPGVEAVMSSALIPLIVTAVANGEFAANVLLEVTSTSLVAPVAAPVVCRLSPVFRVLLPAPVAVTNGSAFKTVLAVVAVKPAGTLGVPLASVAKPEVGVSTPCVRKTPLASWLNSPCNRVCAGKAPRATPVVYCPVATSNSAFATSPSMVLG